MLAPLVRLPQLELISPNQPRCASSDPGPIEVQVSLELNPREPAIDFAQQLLGMVHQVSISGGIIFSPACLQFARRLIRHAEAVSTAWAETDLRRKLHHRRE